MKQPKQYGYESEKIPWLVELTGTLLIPLAAAFLIPALIVWDIGRVK